MSQRASIKSRKSKMGGPTRRFQDAQLARRRRAQQITRAPASTLVVSQGAQSAFANRQIVTLRYAERLSGMTGGVGTGDAQVYRANSIFDPDFTGVGHQPMGTDQYQAIYHHYRVRAARISVQFSQNDGSTVPITCWVALSSTSTVTGNARTAIEGGYAAWKTIGTFGNEVDKPLVNIYNAKKFFGPTAIDADHKASFSANPQEDVFFHVAYQPTLATDTGVGVTGMVVIEYDCELTEPVNLSPS